MRKELYEGLCVRLGGMTDPAIRHIDLWNRNVEFIEQEEAWPRPAVFIEFGPIQWDALVGGGVQKGTMTVSLHVVTDWRGSAGQTEEFDYSERIQRALDGLRGADYYGLELFETHTNHDHEELVESVEVYRLRCLRRLPDVRTHEETEEP